MYGMLLKQTPVFFRNYRLRGGRTNDVHVTACDHTYPCASACIERKAVQLYFNYKQEKLKFLFENKDPF